MPTTSLIASAVALLVTGALLAVLWFDRLFEAPGAVHTSSLVEHLSARSLLAVFAHPDDETLVAGALADAAARPDAVVRTITLTRGEKGYSAAPSLRPKDLALVREAELRRYGAALGVDHQEVWRYPDGALREVDRQAIVSRLVRQIRKSRPDLVLTFDPAGGFNGHRDHTAAGELTVEAVTLARDVAFRPNLGDPHVVRHLVYVVGPRGAFRTLGGPELRKVAADQPAANVVCPVDSRLRMLGWQMHASQRLDRAYPLPGWLLFNFWDKEHYVVVDVGSEGSSHRDPSR